MARTFRVRIFYHMLEGFFMKVILLSIYIYFFVHPLLIHLLFPSSIFPMQYVWSSTGLIMIALPSFLYSKNLELRDGEVIAGRTRYLFLFCYPLFSSLCTTSHLLHHFSLCLYVIQKLHYCEEALDRCCRCVRKVDVVCEGDQRAWWLHRPCLG